MEHFHTAKWIWLRGSDADSYGEFYQAFFWEAGSVHCRISCDGDYTLYINGSYASSWQYGDFAHYKIYDEIDITPYLQKGENHLAVLVWHYGAASQRYVPAQAGLLFEVTQGKAVLAASNENTLCRQSRAFISGRKKWITQQMGFSFSYDATREDDWKLGNMTGGENAAIVSKDCRMGKRPIEKNGLDKPAASKCLIADGDYYLFDLGQETVGVPMLSFVSSCGQSILVQWGEDLQNGHVRRVIDDRDFSFEYRAKPGKNEFINYMLRIGCRYLEVFAEKPIETSYVGLCPTPYPVEVIPKKLPDPLDQKIYDTCVRTLGLCLMDHYVDTPWREQCLYAFDARNQMLCGYFAFAGKNARYARANLKLMSEDRREDGLLSITYPCGVDLTIPSFSLHYFKAVREYGYYTRDMSLAKEVYPKLQSILDAFMKQRKDGLVFKFEGAKHWNFYDWSAHLDGTLHSSQPSVPDLVLNCLFLMACQDLSAISQDLETAAPELDAILTQTRSAAKQAFYHPEDGLFSMTAEGREYTVLGNALAILAGLTDREQALHICNGFAQGLMTDCSLSMKTFQYDAMLQTDKSFGKAIIDEIRSVYGGMLACGATSVWETAEGAAAFDNAGSLCHGWSAVPVYYYHLLCQEKLAPVAPKQKYYLRDNVTGNPSDRCCFSYELREAWLHFQFEVRDDTLDSPYTKDNETLYTADAVEVFISPDGDLSRYRELELSPFGVRFNGMITYDQAGRHLEMLEPDFLSQVQRTQDGYRAQIDLPLSGLADFDPAKCRLNAFCLDRTDGDTQKMYALSPTMRDLFHVPECFVLLERK